MKKTGAAAGRKTHEDTTENVDSAGVQQPGSPLQFVTANPLPNAAEKSNMRALVRANATKFRWRQMRKAQGQPSPSVSAGMLRQRTKGAAHAGKSTPEPSAAPDARRPTGQLSRPRSDEAAGNAKEGDDGGDGAGLWQLAVAVAGPQRSSSTVKPKTTDVPVGPGGNTSFDWLMTGRIDPCEEYPSELPKHVVTTTLEQSSPTPPPSSFLSFPSLPKFCV